MAFTEDVGEALRGLRLARPDRRLDQRRQGVRRGRAGAHAAIENARQVTDRPSFIVLRTLIAWPAPNAQGTGKAHGSALGEDEVAATKEILGFDPERDVLGRHRGARPHPERWSSAARPTRPRGSSELEKWKSRKPHATCALCERLQTRALPTGWDDALPTFAADPRGWPPARPPAR